MMDSFRGDALTIAASNHQGLLDSALWRRFDEILLFERPDEKSIEELLVRNLRQIMVDPGANLSAVAKLLNGMTHADVERVALDAAKQAILSGAGRVEQDMLAQAVSRQQDRREVTQDAGTLSPSPRRSSSRHPTDAMEASLG
jgi:AAA+ superfamily predicted ATPase